MQTAYLRDIENKPIYPITSSSCVMTKEGTLDEKLDGLEEKVDNALPKSGGVVSGGLVAKGSITSRNESVGRDARIANGSTGATNLVNAKVGDPLNYASLLLGNENTALKSLLSVTVGKDGSAKNYLMYGDHNLDYVKQKLGGGDTVQYKKIGSATNVTFNNTTSYTLVLPKPIKSYLEVKMIINITKFTNSVYLYIGQNDSNGQGNTQVYNGLVGGFFPVVYTLYPSPKLNSNAIASFMYSLSGSNAPRIGMFRQTYDIDRFIFSTQEADGLGADIIIFGIER